MRNLIIGIVVLAVAAYFYAQMKGVGTKAPPAEAQPTNTQRSEPVSIDPNVNEPYTIAGGYGTFFDKWGDDGMVRVERTRRGAAQIAARSLECDHVEIAELSQQRSVSPTDIVVFVDCTNHKRFFFSEQEVIAAGY